MRQNKQSCLYSGWHQCKTWNFFITYIVSIPVWCHYGKISKSVLKKDTSKKKGLQLRVVKVGEVVWSLFCTRISIYFFSLSAINHIKIKSKKQVYLQCSLIQNKMLVPKKCCCCFWKPYKRVYLCYFTLRNRLASIINSTSVIVIVLLMLLMVLQIFRKSIKAMLHY